jgi:hypothetical protein
MTCLVDLDVMEVGVALEGNQRAIVKRAIKALEEALYKFQQHGFREEDWVEEIRLAALDLEELLEP